MDTVGKWNRNSTNEQCEKVPRLNNRYLVEKVWQYLHLNNMEIRVRKEELQEKQRVNDEYLMRIIMDTIESSKWKVIKNFRMYLKFITVSDTTEWNDAIIKSDVCDGISKNESRRKWPIESRPTPDDWKTWRWELQKTVMNKEGRSTLKLGWWIEVPCHLISKYMIATSGEIYCKSNG